MAESRVGKAYPQGAVLFRDGEPGASMYVLQSGRVRVFKEVRGKDKTLAVLGPGEFFGEMSILNGKPRTATAEVIEDAKLLEIDAKRFGAMVTQNAEIAVRLIRRIAQRLDDANALVEILMHRDPHARAILGLARAAKPAGDGGGFVVSVDPEELASQVGIGADEVRAAINRLWRLSLLEDRPDGLLLPSLDRIRDFLEFLQTCEKRGAA